MPSLSEFNNVIYVLPSLILFSCCILGREGEEAKWLDEVDHDNSYSVS
jgi:hypothetical protein